MCLTKITYYSCKCVESRREVWCPLPKPACPEQLRDPVVKVLGKPCLRHGGRGARDDAPTLQKRWSPARVNKPSNIPSRQYSALHSPLSPVSPVSSEAPWPATGSSTPGFVSYPALSEEPVSYPTLPRNGATQFPTTQDSLISNTSANASGRRSGSSAAGRRPGSSGRRTNTKRYSGMSATVNPAVDLACINMPGRNRSSMYNLNSLAEQIALGELSSPPLPVPVLPPQPGGPKRTNNATRRPAPIDTNVRQFNTRRTSPRQGAVAKPRSVPPRVAARPFTTPPTQAPYAAEPTSYRDALAAASRWVSSLHGPWTPEVFACQPLIACLRPADQAFFWQEFEKRNYADGVAAALAAARQHSNRGQQQVCGNRRPVQDQHRDPPRRGGSGRKTGPDNASSGCEVM